MRTPGGVLILHLWKKSPHVLLSPHKATFVTVPVARISIGNDLV